jgi:ADP-ribose pyrophosphatase
VTKRLVYEGRSITVWQESAELPNGNTAQLDVVRHPGAAAIVPFETADDVLLIRQFRHAAGGTIWEVPAGKLDGEAPEVCAQRELEEEAGRRAGRVVALGSIWTTPGFTDERIHLFAGFDLEPLPHRREEDEVIEVVRMQLSDALDLVWRGELCDAKSALALIHAARHVGKLR